MNCLIYLRKSNLRRTYYNGKPHLTYYGSALDMWQQQVAKQTTSIGDPTLDYATGGKYPVTDIPSKSGDIAIIDTKESVYDGRVPGIFMIN